MSEGFDPADEALGAHLVCRMGLDDAGCAATPVRHCEGLRGVTQDDGTTKSDSVSSGLVDAAAQDVERLREALKAADDVICEIGEWANWSPSQRPKVEHAIVLAQNWLGDFEAAALTSSPHDGEGGE